MTSPQLISGLLVIDKPLHLTSMDACRQVKRRLVEAGAPRNIKVGHGGTLDPLATGVVVILIGRAATKLCDQIMAGEKRYLAEIDLSRTSTTDDLEGRVTDVPVAHPPTRQHLEAACRALTGTIQQRPPDYSAVWVDGKRAYKLARRGKPTDLKPRPVVIRSIDILDYAWPITRLDIRTGKGAYIRALARDLGQALATGGMLISLRRTALGEFTIDRATPLDSLPARLDQAHLLVP